MNVQTSITPEQKKRRFRELARHDQIKTASRFAEEFEQPYLPLFNDCPDVQRRKSARPVVVSQEGVECVRQ